MSQSVRLEERNDFFLESTLIDQNNPTRHTAGPLNDETGPMERTDGLPVTDAGTHSLTQLLVGPTEGHCDSPYSALGTDVVQGRIQMQVAECEPLLVRE